MGPTAQPKSFEHDGYGFPGAAICKCVSSGSSPRGNAFKEPGGQQEETARRGDQEDSLLSAPISEKVSCKNITELHLSGQSLKSFPDADDLSSLLTLDLSHNEISELPSKLKSSTHLRVLNLSHNRLTEFPEVLVQGLAVLKQVNLSFNALITLPRPACVQHLSEFTARSCQLNEFPRWILFERHCMETLDLSMNPIFERFPLDERLVYHSSMKMLKKVNFSNTYAFDRLRTLFAQLTNVEYLDISNYGTRFCNRLLSCEEVLVPALKVLKATDLGLASNPSLQVCKQLETLNLAKNPMSWINSDFPIESLKIAVLPNCYICSLPDNFGDMINLEYLNLSHNDVASLPSSFARLTGLKHLDLYQNSFSSPPEELGALKQITCLDLCQNHFEPPSHPLGDGRTCYEELRGALRATLAEYRICGMIPNKSTLSDDGSGKYKKYGSTSGSSSIADSDEEDCERSKEPVFIRPLPVNQPEEDWDVIEPTPYRSEDYFADQGLLHHQFVPDYSSSCDLNEHFIQYLQLVPDRIRNSPFYYHRIDTSSSLSPVRKFSRADIVDGQFDD